MADQTLFALLADRARRRDMRALVTIGGVVLVGSALGVLTVNARGVSWGSGESTTCYYDGSGFARPCPADRSGPAQDGSRIYAAVIDTLYFRAHPSPVGSDLVAIEATTSTGDQEGVGLEDIWTRIHVAAPAVPRALVERYQTLNASPVALHALWPVSARQHFLDSAAVRRFFEGNGAERAAATFGDFVPRQGLLTLSRVAVDSTRHWALLYAAVRDADRHGSGAYVLMRRDGSGWRMDRSVGTER